MNFHKLAQLAKKFEIKYLSSQAQAAPPQAGADNMPKIVNAVNALHQMRMYLDALPNFDPNASPSVKNGAAVIQNFKAYQQAVEENIAPYYDAETKQYTPQYTAQKRIPSSTLSLIKKQLMESLPHVSGVASIIWFNAAKDPGIRNQIDGLYMTISSNAAGITF